MHVVVAIASVAVILLALAEYFFTFLLPRRVKRDPRIARGVFRVVWIPWRAVAGRLPRSAGDTMLGIFGPFGLLLILGVLGAGLVAGFAGLYWATSAHLGGGPHSDFGDYFYFSGGDFFSTPTPTTPVSGGGKALQVIEAATGFAFLAIAIGYLPALFQAFSRRETSVTRLDPRAGSPPTAAALLEESSRHGGWSELDAYLHEWESWTAELMETHISYPILGYFRSQHLRQNWVAALTTVVDACAYGMAYGPSNDLVAAELTFRIGRHALADLQLVFSPHLMDDESRAASRQRLTPEALQELRRRLEEGGLHSEDRPESAKRLEKLRESYEPYAIAISRQLRLPLPGWLQPDDVKEYWRIAPGHRLS